MKKKRRTTAAGVVMENPLAPGHWSQNPFLRAGVGVLIAQALSLGLRRYTEAGAAWFAGLDAKGLWANLGGFAVWQLFQLAGVMAGCLVAGSAVAGGWKFGLFIGLANGVISMFAGAIYREGVPGFLFTVQLVIHMAVGAWGGWLGSNIYPPVPPAKSVAESAREKPVEIIPFLSRLMAMWRVFKSPIHWIKLILAVLLTLAGTIFAKDMFDQLSRQALLAELLRNNPQVSTNIFVLIVCWLILFVGGMISGASTRSGAAQGLWAGLLTAALFAGYWFAAKNSPVLKPPEFAPTPQDLFPFLGTIVGVMFVGGLFGGILLPPVVATKREKFTAAGAKI